MTIEEAKILVLLNQSLIGQRVYGKPIDELIILPSESVPQQIFFKIYMESHSAEEALEPFQEYDLIVRCVLNKEKMDLLQTVSCLPLERVKSKLDLSL